MKARRFLFACFAFLSSFLTGTALAQQCSHHVGTWTDNYYYVWTVQSDGGGVVETNGCPYLNTWLFSGSSGNGYVSLNAYNPGDPECTFEFWYNGRISTGGCRVADGTWGNADGLSGTFAMVKSCETPPQGETTLSSGLGWEGPYYRFGAVVSEPGNGNLSGRFYREVDYATGQNTCVFASDPPAFQWDHTSGSEWTLDENDYYEDVFGPGDDLITFYRAQGRTPCTVDLFQRMEISCGTEIFKGPWTQVQSQVLHFEIGTTTVKEIGRAHV